MAADAKPLPVLVTRDRPRGPWRDYVLVVSSALLPVLAVIAKLPLALAAASTVPFAAAAHVFIRRRGGWRLIGPHSYYDLIRTARKGRTTLLRVLFLMALLAAIWYTYATFQSADRLAEGNIQVVERDHTALRETLARFNTRCAFAWLLLQNITILVLTPAFLGGAIAEERERGTLDLLLATKLYSREIALGKLLAQLVHLGSFLIAPLPIFSIMLVWGGIDWRLLIALWLNSALLLVAVGAACLMFSTMPVRASTAVIVSYALVLPGAGFCWAWSYAAVEGSLLRASGGMGPLIGLPSATRSSLGCVCRSRSARPGRRNIGRSAAPYCRGSSSSLLPMCRLGRHARHYHRRRR